MESCLGNDGTIEILGVNTGNSPQNFQGTNPADDINSFIGTNLTLSNMPRAPVDGDQWYHPTNGRSIVFNGSLWQDLLQGINVTAGPDANTIDQGPELVRIGDRIHFHSDVLDFTVDPGSALVGFVWPNCYPVKGVLGEDMTNGTVVSFNDNGTLSPSCNLLRVNQNMIDEGLNTTSVGSTFEGLKLINDPVTGDFYLLSRYTGTIDVLGQTYTAPSNISNYILIKTDSNGNIIWAADVSNNGVGEASTQVFMEYHAGNVYMSIMWVHSGSVGNVNKIFVNSDGSNFGNINFTNSTGNQRRAALCKINSFGFWQNTVRITGVPAAFGSDSRSGPFVIDPVENKMYIGFVYRRWTLELPGNGGIISVDPIGGTTSTSISQGNRVLYARVDLATMTFDWVQNVGTGNVGGLSVGGVTIDNNRDVYFAITGGTQINSTATGVVRLWTDSRSNPAGTQINSLPTSPFAQKTFGPTSNLLNSIIFKIDKSTGFSGNNPTGTGSFWYKLLSINNFSDLGIEKLLFVNGRIYCFCSIQSTANYGNYELSSVEFTATPTNDREVFMFYIDPVTGTSTPSSLNQVISSANNQNNLGDAIFYCSFDNSLYISGTTNNSAILTYQSLPPITATNNWVLRTDLDLNGLSLDVLLPNEGIQTCDSRGSYFPVSKGFVGNGTESSDGGFMRIGTAADNIFGILAEDGLAGETRNVCCKGIYCNPAWTLTPGTVYYLDCTLDPPLTTTFIPNQQIGIAVHPPNSPGNGTTTNCILLSQIKGDLDGNGNFSSVTADNNIITRNLCVSQNLKTSNVVPLAGDSFTISNTNTVVYNNPTTASRVFHHFKAETDVNSTTFNGLNNLVDVAGVSLPTGVTGTTEVINLLPLVDNIDIDGVGLITVCDFKVHFLIIENNITSNPGVGSYDLIFTATVNASGTISTINMVDFTASVRGGIPGDSVSYFIDPINPNGQFLILYTQSTASGGNRAIRGTVEIICTN